MTHANFHELARFLGVGGVNLLVGLSIIYFAKWFLHFGDVASNAAGYSVGLMISFVLNGRWTFLYNGPHGPALIRFLFSTLLAYGMNLLVVLSAIHYFDLNGYLAQAIGIPFYTLTSYLTSKYFVFRA